MITHYRIMVFLWNRAKDYWSEPLAISEINMAKKIRIS